MRGRTWLPKKPKPSPKPKVSDEVRHSVETKLAPILTKLKKRIPKRPESPLLKDGIAFPQLQE